MSDFTPLKTGLARVFTLEKRAGPANKPAYNSCMKPMGISQSFGDITKIEAPDPERYGQFIEIGQVRGAEERMTTSLMSRYALDLASTLIRMAKKRCSVDVQAHFGQCQDPSDFNSFTQALIYEDVAVTNYGTDDLGALESGEDAKVDETADISAKLWYQFFENSYGQKASSIVTNEVVDVVICDTASCGSCTDASDGCEKIFAVTLAAGGSPGTPPDVVFSLDKGVTWYAHDIDSMTSADNADGVACFGSYLIVVSEDTESLHYALLSEFDGTTDPDFTEMTTGFVAGNGPLDVWAVGSNYVFIVGENGYIYGTDDPTASVTVLDAGTLTSSNYLAVHALSTEFAVAVGNDGVIAKTENGTVWTSLSATSPVGVGVNLTAVWLQSTTSWFVGTSGGQLFYTSDGGTTWTEKTFPGSGTGVIWDLQFPTMSVGYMSHATTTPSGRILETVDGGYSWIVAPRGTGTLTSNDRITALTTCSNDPNFVVGVGLADDGSDGFVIVGQD